MDVPATPRTVRGASVAGSVLARWGGILVHPRRAVAALSPTEGLRDGLWLGLLYLIGTSLYQLVEGVATLYAVRNYSGLIAVASVIGRAVLAPVLTLVVAETILGRERAYRRGLALVPLVVLGCAVHMARQLGQGLPLSELGAAIAGGAIGVALIWWVRPEVEPEEVERE